MGLRGWNSHVISAIASCAAFGKLLPVLLSWSLSLSSYQSVMMSYRLWCRIFENFPYVPCAAHPRSLFVSKHQYEHFRVSDNELDECARSWLPATQRWLNVGRAQFVAESTDRIDCLPLIRSWWRRCFRWPTASDRLTVDGSVTRLETTVTIVDSVNVLLRGATFQETAGMKNEWIVSVGWYCLIWLMSFSLESLQFVWAVCLSAKRGFDNRFWHPPGHFFGGCQNQIALAKLPVYYPTALNKRL